MQFFSVLKNNGYECMISVINTEKGLPSAFPSHSHKIHYRVQYGNKLLKKSKSCVTLCDPWTGAHQAPLSMGILQARILEWVAISFSRGFSQPRDWTRVSRIAGRHVTIWATREARSFYFLKYNRTSLLCVSIVCTCYRLYETAF